MIDTTIYDNLLSTLDTTIAQQKTELERLMIEAKKEGQNLVELENLKNLTNSIQTALNNKDLDALNKIIADANNTKG